MSEKEKQRFHEMAEHDKKRYDLEMQTYVPPKDVKMGRGRKRHQIKDPNAPKRSLWVMVMSLFNIVFFFYRVRAKSKSKSIIYGLSLLLKDWSIRLASVANCHDANILAAGGTRLKMILCKDFFMVIP